MGSSKICSENLSEHQGNDFEMFHTFFAARRNGRSYSLLRVLMRNIRPIREQFLWNHRVQIKFLLLGGRAGQSTVCAVVRSCPRHRPLVQDARVEHRRSVHKNSQKSIPGKPTRSHSQISSWEQSTELFMVCAMVRSISAIPSTNCRAGICTLVWASIGFGTRS